MKLKTKEATIIEVSDWDELVRKVYKRPYSYQQQDGCRGIGIYKIEVPFCWAELEFSVEDWLSVEYTVPFTTKSGEVLKEKWHVDMHWEREVYPEIELIANDLHSKGLLKAGTYYINVDW